MCCSKNFKGRTSCYLLKSSLKDLRLNINIKILSTVQWVGKMSERATSRSSSDQRKRFFIRFKMLFIPRIDRCATKMQNQSKVYATSTNLYDNVPWAFWCNLKCESYEQIIKSDPDFSIHKFGFLCTKIGISTTYLSLRRYWKYPWWTSS